MPTNPTTNGEPSAQTVADVVATYLKHLDLGSSAARIQEKRSVLARLVQDLGTKPLTACRPLDLVAWVKRTPRGNLRGLSSG